ncbi:MAG: hemolysin III family protein [Gammaproteobacteria bacterium]|nr:hemolysin III family protein [Gammaproteobacteria bacterium]MBT8133128.1 hemolysin III family protein [Gammaproteobacteria bacterium]NNJ49472.1 hemolysin III family protein [Gammaproteobacteria bacterium]
MNNKVKTYSPAEERVNISSHALGLLLSIAALALLVTHATASGDVWHIVSFSIFGSSLIILFAASTIYHSARDPDLRARLRVVDHASIYVLIAGTYTPFTLVTLNGSVGWTIFAITWGMALSGIVLKLFFTGRYQLVSTLMYVFMGWIIVFAISPLIDNLHPDGLSWLVAGGVAYTVGAILYGIKKIKFNHATFHVFVLIGAFCHFMAVYFYVLPDA